MIQIKKYNLPPTALIPNSPLPLLHYPNFLSSPSSRDPTKVHEIFSHNGWQVQWIYRYGPTQQSHYHSAAHECMAVLSGEATIRFGAADEPGADLEESTHGRGKEDGGVEVKARAGDVFVLPAGVAHKTFDTEPVADFQLLTPGDGHHVAGKDVAKSLQGVELSGFTMMGAYPEGGRWDFAVGGEHKDRYEEVWNVPKPGRDPVLGLDPAGLTGLWE
ncbi:hypothetical protein VMCG_01381 [Cytospora schulzeri]|uniref:Cupin type-1 domain-containing protein n=1 Tax=Cytospora schulzeri TaxID=448051 RepID=A0A423X6N1_9PEZI|nr:hypothetical protein VMCG_01381 [Valsa malicola]